MDANFIHHLSSGLSTYVVEPALRSLVMAICAGIALAMLRVRNVTVRLAVWRAVLGAALAMPILVALLPSLTFAVPKAERLEAFLLERLTPGQAEAQHAAPLQTQSESTVTVNREVVARQRRAAQLEAFRNLPPSAAALSTSAPSPAESGNAQSWSRWVPSAALWGSIFAAAYLAVAFCFLGRFCAGLVRCRKLATTSTPVDDARLQLELRLRVRELGLTTPPRLAETCRISVPLTLGVAQPAILFPTDWREWDERKLRAVLAHELSHVARRDALTQRLALLHSALFWFSPLSWWLERRLAELAEEASDEAALASGLDRANYAETLLSFFATLQSAPGRVWWQGLSMASSSKVERRVDRILAWKGNISMSLKKSLLFGVALLAAPGVLLIAAARPAYFSGPLAPRSVAEPRNPAPPQAPDAAITVRPASQDGIAPEPLQPATPSAVPTPALPAPAAPVPAAPVPAATGPVAPALRGVNAPALPEAPREPGPQGGVPSVTPDKPTIYIESGSSNSERAYHFHGPNGCNSNGWGHNMVSVGVGDECTNSSSSAKDLPAISAEISADSIAFDRDGKSYVIQDAATVAHARQLFDRMISLGEQQSQLGRQQSALGDKQSALGEQMEQVRVKMPDLTAQLREIEAKMKELSANGGTVSQLGELQSQLGEVQSRIGEIESHAGEEQGKIGERQGELGRQQGELGKKQGELGKRESEESEKAVRELKKLLDEAVSRNLAKPQSL